MKNIELKLNYDELCLLIYIIAPKSMKINSEVYEKNRCYTLNEMKIIKLSDKLSKILDGCKNIESYK